MRGFCFLGEPEGGKRHMKIILSEPDGAGLVVVATVFSLRRPNRQEMSCVLKPGDHPFIRHDSVVAFGGAVPMPAVEILGKQFSGAFAPMPEMPPAAFARVLAAARTSSRLPAELRPMIFPADAP